MQHERKIRYKMFGASYYTTTRAMMQEHIGVKDDRQMRRWLQQDVAEGLINRIHSRVWNEWHLLLRKP